MYNTALTWFIPPKKDQILLVLFFTIVINYLNLQNKEIKLVNSPERNIVIQVRLKIEYTNNQNKIFKMLDFMFVNRNIISKGKFHSNNTV